MSCPKFTDAQVLWLNTVFPENIIACNTEDMYVRLGQRQVVKRIEREMELARQRVIKDTRG